MKRLLILGLSILTSAMNMQGAAASREIVPAKKASELGYQAGYAVGSMVGKFGGMQERRDNVSDKNKRTTLTRDVIDAATEEALSPQELRSLAIRFADANAENAFKRGYREGYGAGWTDGHQVGYSNSSAPASATDIQGIYEDLFGETPSEALKEQAEANADFFRSPGSDD